GKGLGRSYARDPASSRFCVVTWRGGRGPRRSQRRIQGGPSLYSPVSPTLKIILAFKIEEDVPEAIPINNASVKSRTLSPPNRVSAESVSSTVSDVLSERDIVWMRLVSTTVSKLSEVRRARFSRMRSKTTMVSWTEKPITVSTAVRKSVSTLKLKKW